MPIRKTFSQSCARAVSGHATTAPPTNVMNSRRFMEPLEPQDYGNCGLNDTTPSHGSLGR
jgi:hypothetical protein